MVWLLVLCSGVDNDNNLLMLIPALFSRNRPNSTGCTSQQLMQQSSLEELQLKSKDIKHENILKENPLM